MAAVRLLLRRTGIRRPAPTLEPLIEVEEVFRVDVIAAAFENRFPALRVIFRITQPAEDRDLDADYPLELPEQRFRPVQLPLEHAAREPARAIHRAIYDGDTSAFNRLRHEQLNELVDLYGPGENALCEHDWPWIPFLTSIGLSRSHLEFLQLEDENERELCRLISEWIIDYHPSHAIVALHYFDDLVGLSCIRNYCSNPEHCCYPYLYLGDSEEFRLFN